MIGILCYLWDGPRPFEPAFVNALARQVRLYLPAPHRFICITENLMRGFAPFVDVVMMPPAARELLHVKTPEGAKFPSSYPRLWTLSAEAAGLFETLGIDRVMLLDIDLMIVRDMTPLFVPQNAFVGWNVRPPPGCPPRFGGGTWLHTPGTRRHVYEDFVRDPAAAIAAARAAGYRGSDQAWISYKLTPTETYWPEPSGIYCAQDYRKAWRNGIAAPMPAAVRRRRPAPRVRSELEVPHDAIILHMNGIEKPWNVDDPIVRKHWHPFTDARARDC